MAGGRGVPDPDDQEQGVPSDEEVVEELPAMDLSEAQHRRNQNGPEISVYPPALAQGSAQGRGLLAAVGQDNGLMTPRPPYALVSVNPKNEQMYFMPTALEIPGKTVEINYDDYRFSFNLGKAFGKLNRLVPEGFREVYKLHATSHKVKIEGHTGRSLYIKLREFTQKPIDELTEEEKAQRAARKKQKKKDPGSDMASD